MQRHASNALINWAQRKGRRPLLVRGARQTGKTYLVEELGRTYFEDLVTVNFEFDPRFKGCFNSLAPDKIISAISLLTNKKITPGKTLLFLDEIQACPQAIQALRYFYEMMPSLHVIGAGSLLEFTLNAANFSMPVGRVEFLHLYPMSFTEMLLMLDENITYEWLQTFSFNDKVPEPVHEKLLALTRLYYLLGGMPQVLAAYRNEQDLLECRRIQASLLQTYRADFGKYASMVQQRYCERIFEKSPGLIATHFKYNDLDPDMDARGLKYALNLLKQANILTPVYATHANQLPLTTTQKDKRLKWLFLDIGLVQAANPVSPEHLLNQDLMLSQRGSLAEQFIGQHLMTMAPNYEPSVLHYWQRDTKGSQAEVDYVIQHNMQIIPLEVKAGKSGRLKSLHSFLQSHDSPLGVKLSQDNFRIEDKLWHVPLYMIEQLPRLLKNHLTANGP